MTKVADLPAADVTQNDLAALIVGASIGGTTLAD
jgi:hypothetical protein